MINVGVDAWGGRPASEAEIIDLINAGPQNLEVLPWVFRPMNLRRTARTAVDLGAMLDEDRGRLDVDLSRSRLA